MKEKIRVKPIFGNHQIYQEIVNYPPNNALYLGVGEETKKGGYYQDKRIKERLGSILRKLKLPRLILVKPDDYQIVHSSRGIIPLNAKSWVIDAEQVHSFFSLDPKMIKIKIWKKFIENRLKARSCKAILCHCKATERAFLKYLDCNNFKDKLKVLYPASHIIKLKKKKHKKIRILCVLSIFYNKGGPQVLEAFSRLEKKYDNIELWIKADVNEEMKKKYDSKNIIYIPYHNNILPREELLKKLYSQCDIFLYPTLTDSFGYSLIDAKIAKLPIVTTNLFAIPEIVKNGFSGLIIKIPEYHLEEEYSQTFPWKKLKGEKEERFIREIMKALEKLIKNKKLRLKMGKKGFEDVKKGKFSIAYRNKILEEVYKEALK